MIKSVLIFNNHGNPRMSKFYQPIDIATQQALVKEIFNLISKRPDTVCNFLEGSQMLGGQDTRVIYRHYATLYFVFVVDESESELGILDLIQVFVESLDKSFQNVCELDLIFHFKEVHDILAEVITGGLVPAHDESTYLCLASCSHLCTMYTHNKQSLALLFHINASRYWRRTLERSQQQCRKQDDCQRNQQDSWRRNHHSSLRHGHR
ncbi:clathrin adaptor complex small chain-domain-containing protein [Mortierella sp. GBAus27b]|nr:clathrin adaptor complex small chain-domain-containing protein [Mortierella sp. GBAus27b]